MHIYLLQRDRSGLTSSPLTDELQPIFLSRQPAAHGVELGFGEGHSAATALTRDLNEGRGSCSAPGLGLYFDEAGFGARRYLAGKLTRSLIARYQKNPRKESTDHA